MLSLEDCIAFSGLTKDQLDAVACHERLPLIIIAEWAESTLDREDGSTVIESILTEEVRVAPVHHPDRVADWRRALDEFRAAVAH